MYGDALHAPRGRPVPGRHPPARGESEAAVIARGETLNPSPSPTLAPPEGRAPLPDAAAHDAYTAGHAARVRGIALAIGEQLALEPGELAALGDAALFHDIGKLAVPHEILLKPARLTDDEWVLMRRHSVDGAQMIGALGCFDGAVPAIRHHHERFDGRGYPDGLAGEEIPLAARVVHVADALDSMLSTRVYRPGRPARAALAELRRERGSQFCPECVEALERAVASGALADEGLTPASLVAAVR